MKQVLAFIVFISGLGTAVLALLAILGRIEGLWPAGICLVVCVGAYMLDPPGGSRRK